MEVVKRKKKKSKISKVKRFIDVKIVNMEKAFTKKKGADSYDIVTNEANGDRVVIKDNYEGPISEYVYNNLKDAIITDHVYEKDATGKVVGKESVPIPRIQIFEKSAMYSLKSGERVFDIPEEVAV